MLTKRCTHCGRPLPMNANFCTNCGAPAMQQPIPPNGMMPQQGGNNQNKMMIILVALALFVAAAVASALIVWKTMSKPDPQPAATPTDTVAAVDSTPVQKEEPKEIAAPAKPRYTRRTPTGSIGVVYSPDGEANVRTGPGTRYPITTVLKQNEIVYLGPKVNGWYRLDTTYSPEGYVRDNLITALPQGCGGSAPVQSYDGFANIRKGPGANYAIVGKARNGQWLLLGRRSGSWTVVYNINGSVRGYVKSNLLAEVTDRYYWGDLR